MKISISGIRNYLNPSTEPPEIWSLKRVRAVLRGYRIMRAMENKNLLKNIREQLTETKIKSNYLPFSGYIMPYNSEIAELSYRQYLLLNLIGTRLNASVLAHLSNNNPIIFPLPLEWIKVMQRNNLKVAVTKSRLIFFFFAVKQFCIAIANYIKYIGSNFIYQFERKKQSKNDFIYFMGLQPDCLPPADGSFRYNIIEWYLSWPGKEKGIREIRHSIKIPGYEHKDTLINYSSYLPKIDNTYNFLVFVVWGFLSLILSFCYLVAGHLKYAIFLSEIQKAKIFSLSDRSSIGKDYLNNNENMIYRPLWTYAAESHGAKITLYNWSAGFADLLGSHGYPPPEIGEKTQNWPYILQWSSLYSEYLRSIIMSKNTEVKVVPPIYFSDSVPVSYKSNRPIIVVFDVTPQKKYFHDILTPSVEYRTYLIGKQFLEDIYMMARQNGFDILWKRKRNFVVSNHSKAYINFSNKFGTFPGVIDADPRTSAFRLVQEADAVISMPFTSTAVVGESFKKPSVYYDPTKKLYKEDRGAQGLSLLLGKEELNEWMQSLKKKTI